VGLLWYNVFGTDDARQRLGGQPYDNSDRVYTGSSDDPALNAAVDRFHADAASQAGLARFATTGALSVPLVNLHTTGDPIVPIRQSELYENKVNQAGSASELTYVPVDRFGHCTFEQSELLSAFSQLEKRIGPRTAVSPLAIR
jgi:alpha-beta hydrolase superfamily lysophospholipase